MGVKMSREITYVKPHELIIIGLDTEDREENPLYDERVFQPVDEALIKNIMVYGIQQPVLVRQEAGRYYVVDGRQRTRAARRAATMQDDAGEYQVKVPVREVRADDKRIAGIMVSTNELRQDDEVLTKANKASRLLDLVGDINEVAIAFGRTPQQIRNWLKLAEADSSIHAAIKTGVISASAGIELSRYPREEQEEALERATQAAGGKAVSEATARQDRAEQGHSTRTSKATPTASSGSTTNRQSRAQAGVKRTWLRDALKTKAAKGISDEQKAVLTWMCTGYAEEGSWIADFVDDASREME
jgi:ParB family chromosome partitioning protein